MGWEDLDGPVGSGGWRECSSFSILPNGTSVAICKQLIVQIDGYLVHRAVNVMFSPTTNLHDYLSSFMLLRILIHSWQAGRWVDGRTDVRTNG